MQCGKVVTYIYVIQIVVGWGLEVVGVDRSFMVPCGDIIVAISVIFLGYIFMKFKSSPFETMMRTFEKKFI